MSNDLSQTCKACGRRDKFDFHGPYEVWCSVVPIYLQNLVVCLTCFDEFAEKMGVDYAPYIKVLYFVGGHTSIDFEATSYVSD